MNVSIFSQMAYEYKYNWMLGENKPKTNPKQTQSNPIKPNFRKAKMNANVFVTKDYRKNDAFAVQKNKPNSNPNKANFKCKERWWRNVEMVFYYIFNFGDFTNPGRRTFSSGSHRRRAKHL